MKNSQFYMLLTVMFAIAGNFKLSGFFIVGALSSLVLTVIHMFLEER